MQAMEKLQQQHMQQLVLDLRDNGGGIMQQAVEIADEFFSDEKLIVYTQGNIRLVQNTGAAKMVFLKKGN
jgi:carboxyl-terminal processing protease